MSICTTSVLSHRHRNASIHDLLQEIRIWRQSAGIAEDKVGFCSLAWQGPLHALQRSQASQRSNRVVVSMFQSSEWLLVAYPSSLIVALVPLCTMVPAGADPITLLPPSFLCFGFLPRPCEAPAKKPWLMLLSRARSAKRGTPNWHLPTRSCLRSIKAPLSSYLSELRV